MGKTEKVFFLRHSACSAGKMHATGHEVGLLINFGHYPKIEFERLVRTRKE
jgi:hypothetical protein